MRRITTWLAPVLLLCGCGVPAVTHDAALKQVKVGSHLFNVPEQHIAEDDVAFLPAADATDGLYILLDPDVASAERIRVVVNTAEQVCAFGTPPVIDQVPRACAVARGQAAQPRPGRLRKAPRFPGDDTQYDYKGEDGGVAVSCNGGPGRSGSCSATYAWRDLIWDASFDEAQVPRLEEIRAAVARRLDEWAANA